MLNFVNKYSGNRNKCKFRVSAEILPIKTEDTIFINRGNCSFPLGEAVVTNVLMSSQSPLKEEEKVQDLG